MENNIFDIAIESLLEQMIKEHFKSINGKEEKFIVTKEQLCQFSMSLVALIAQVDKR